jgi:hypothetical protein
LVEEVHHHLADGMILYHRNYPYVCSYNHEVCCEPQLCMCACARVCVHVRVCGQTDMFVFFSLGKLFLLQYFQVTLHICMTLSLT